MYGSPARRFYAALAERAAGIGLAHADATRGLSPFTGGLAEEATGRPPTALFPTYFDLRSFLAEPPQPLPDRPSAIWIGVLQRYKDPQLLADAWRIVADQLPEARLKIVGDGPLYPIVESLKNDLPDSVDWTPSLRPGEVARALDDATLLSLTSPNEGLGRVIVESFTRARPVVACRGGGVVDLIEPEQNGLLAPAGDAEAVAEALVRVMGDRKFAEKLGNGALLSSLRWRWSPERYADELRGLVDRVLAEA
jgi:glycosyltransferase involved in cell wall biosynthesis